MNAKTITPERKILTGFNKAIMLIMIIAASIISNDALAQQKKSTKKTDKNAQTTEAPAAPATPSKESVMRKLWNDHIVWTRQYMISEMNDSPDKGAIYAKLRENQREIAKEMKAQHPAVDEATLASMLDSTVLTMTRLIFETNLGGESGDAYKTKEHLMQQLDRIAGYLNSVNPGWKLPEMKLMMQSYLNETHNQMLARKNRIWDADIAAYDRLNNHVMKMADAFATGTIVLDGGQSQTGSMDPNMKTGTPATGKSAGTGK